MRTYGRHVIYANYTEKELLSMNSKELYATVLEILNNSIKIHNDNANECKYLIDYWRGKQDIYTEKKKVTRPEINHTIVENWAYDFIDFKSCWLLGEPIQYAQHNDSSSKELSILNDYCSYENKKTKDLLIYQDSLICGRGFRYIASDEPKDEDEAPFELINLKPFECEVVYSSSIGNEQLLSYVETSMYYIDTNDQNKMKYYHEYTIYLRNKKLVYSDKSGSLQIVDQLFQNKTTKEIPILMNEHCIKEYYLNPCRISLIEIGKDLFDSINSLESLDMDDFDQFVNALLVFTNADFDTEDIKQVKEIGAMSIKSTGEKPAKVELLEQRLNANTTQTYYSRLVNALHHILGIPKPSDSGEVSYGDTGQARLTGQGYTSAGIKIKSDQMMFEMCDRETLKTILKICKAKNSEIKNLKVIDIEPRFQLEMKDNILVKSEALKVLYDCKIPRKFANAIIGLFGDANAVTEEQERIFGKEGQTLNNSNNINETKQL